MLFKSIITSLALVLSAGAFAQAVQVEGAWARASVPGQKASGAFMKITTRDGARLVGVSSPVAGLAEVHEMKLEGDIMRMRAVPTLDLPAGKTVEFKSGGYHLMLMNLKAPLVRDSTVPLTLVFRDARGVESRVELKVPVRSSAPGAEAESAGHMHHGAHGQHKH